MADQDAQDRNLPASPKKIQKSRAEGQLPRSRDLPRRPPFWANGLCFAIGTFELRFVYEFKIHRTRSSPTRNFYPNAALIIHT